MLKAGGSCKSLSLIPALWNMIILLYKQAIHTKHICWLRWQFFECNLSEEYADPIMRAGKFFPILIHQIKSS